MRGRSRTILVFLVICACVAACTWKVLSAPGDLYPGGIDAMGHMSKVEQVALKWKQGDFSDWYPLWYNGATASEYYPPFAIWVPALLQLASNDMRVAFKIFTFACLTLGGLTTALLYKKMSRSLLGATIAGVYYATGIYTLYTTYGDATLGRILALPIFPMLFGALIDLSDQPSFRNWLKSAAYVGILILTHAMHAYLLFIAAGLFILVRNLMMRTFVSLIHLVSAAVIGVALTGFWSVPAYLRLELPDVPYVTPGWNTAWVTPLNRVFSDKTVGSYCLFGLAIIGILFTWRRSRALCSGLTVSAVLTYSFWIGPVNPIYRLIPLGNQIFPGRFANATYLPCAILAGFAAEGLCDLLDSGYRKHSMLLRVCAMLFLACLSVGEALWKKPVQPFTSYSDMFEAFRKLPPVSEPFAVGRIITELATANSTQAYLTSAFGYNSSSGWNLEGTPHGPTLAGLNQCYGQGFDEYVLSTWDRWNVRYALLDSRSPRLLSMLSDRGWQETAFSPDMSLFVSSRVSSYVQEYRSKTLVIGRSSFFARRLIPEVTEGEYENPLEYSDEYLQMFNAFWLYDLPDVDTGALEQWIIKWTNLGKKVVVDLSASQSVPSLLGVQSLQAEIQGHVIIDSNRPEVDGFELDVDKGAGATYSNLDEVWMSSSIGGQEVAICGIRELQRGSVVFVGLHIPRLVASSSKDVAASFLMSLIGQDNVSGSGLQGGRDIGALKPVGASGLSFNYTLATDMPLLVSITYTPRWHITIDGNPFKVFRNEGLILIDAPAGTHRVEMAYGRTPVVYYGWAVSAFGLAYVVVQWVMTSAKHRGRQSFRQTA